VDKEQARTLSISEYCKQLKAALKGYKEDVVLPFPLFAKDADSEEKTIIGIESIKIK
jgi:hypothetical protein